MFELHNYTPQPPGTQAPFSALRQDLPYISFDPLGDVATIAAVEEGDGCQASATLLDAFLEERAAAINPGDIPDLSLGEDYENHGAYEGHIEPLADVWTFDAYSKHLDEVFETPPLGVNTEGFARNRPQQGEAPPIVLPGFNPADWEGKKAPPRLWVVPDYIPNLNVTLLYADGGTGKSYLKLQLAVARALAKEWIGLLPEPGRTLVLSTEDDLDEMWRRIEGMLPFFGARMADLGDIRLVDLVGENSVLGVLTKGIIEPTPIYAALDAYIGEFKPGLVELDVLADMFSGEENNRPQVTQFIGLLKRLCRKHSCAVLLLAQPSVAGMNTGSGTSGSTGWSNSGRSRLYFQRVKTDEGAEPNKNLRTFEGKKANYSVTGAKFEVEWKGGLFRRVSGPTGFDTAAEQKADDVFLKLLRQLTKQNIPVRATVSRSGAPVLFAARTCENQGLNGKDFEAAMHRLLARGAIRNELETEGPPSKRDYRLVIP